MVAFGCGQGACGGAEMGPIWPDWDVRGIRTGNEHKANTFVAPRKNSACYPTMPSPQALRVWHLAVDASPPFAEHNAEPHWLLV